MYHPDDTIAAVASAPGPAARGIVRIGGPDLVSILETCFRPRDAVSLSEIGASVVVPGSILLRRAALRELPADLYLWPTNRSYTRGPLAELHTLGSPPLLAQVLATVCDAGARMAEPGEFTLRAFLAGRLDLAQAEAVLGVIDARDPSELQTALSQLAGGLTGPLHQLRDSLLDLLAHIEAGLDFVEEDIQFIAPLELGRQLDDAAALLARIATQLAERGRHDELPSVVLVGRPNVGKSSLFNALAADGSALVAERPGTTRDYLTATLDLQGVACQLIDTAGVEPNNPTDDEGIGPAAERIAGAQALRADVRLVCIDSTRPPEDGQWQLPATDPDGPRIIALTKCDRAGRAKLPCKGIETSAHRAVGLDRLRHAIRAAIVELSPGTTAAHLTPHRCALSLRTAADSLARAAELNRTRAGEELIGSELRVALDELGKVVGAVYTEDILDRIFSRFCIGK